MGHFNYDLFVPHLALIMGYLKVHVFVILEGINTS